MAEPALDLPEDDNQPVPPAPLAVSPSKLDAAACPHRFLKLYVEGVDEPGSRVMLLLGSLEHDIAKRYTLHLRETNQSSDHAALARIARDAWDNRDEGIPESCYDDHQLFVDELRRFTVDPGTILSAEIQFAFDDQWNQLPWDHDDVAFGGKLDLILEQAKDHLLIVDWTTAALSGVARTKKDLQLRFYALLAWKFTGIARVDVEARSLRTGAVVRVELDEADHVETEKRIRSERYRIKRKLDDRFAEWPAIPGTQCGICSLECPYETRTGDQVRLDTEADAHQTHESLIVLEERRKKLTGLLKTYVGVHGPISSNGIRAEIASTERRSWDVAGLLGYLEARGISHVEALSACSVDSRQLKKLLKNKDDQADAEDLFCTITRGERFAPFARGVK